MCSDVLLAHCINFNLRLENSDLSIPGRTEGQHKEGVGRKGGGVIYCSVPCQVSLLPPIPVLLFSQNNTTTLVEC